MMYIVSISLLALALKILTLWQARALLHHLSPYIIAISISFFGMNFCELSLLNVVLKGSDGFIALVLYYLFSLTAVHAMFALTLTNTAIPRLRWQIPLALLFFLVLIAVVVPKAGILGVTNIGYSITRIPGPYYLVIQIGYCIPLIGTSMVLVNSLLNAKDHKKRVHAKTYLTAFLPFITVCLLVLLLMQLGFRINGSGLLSVTLCLSLWILLFTRSEKNQNLVLSFIPATRESKRIQALANKIADPKRGLKQTLKEMEAKIIEETLAKTDGNITHASKILGIGRSTLSEKISKFGLGQNSKPDP